MSATQRHPAAASPDRATELSGRDPIEIMRRVVQHTDATSQHYLEVAGFDHLTRSQAVVLLLLDDGFTTPSAIRTELEVTQQFVSKCLRLLAEGGCVELIGNPDDKRRRGIVLTKRGRHGVTLVRALRERKLSVVPDDLIEQVTEYLERLQIQARGDIDSLERES